MPRATGRNVEVLLSCRSLSDLPRKTINRSTLVVRPAQPFVDWLQQVDPTSAHLIVHDLRLERPIYLLPEWDTEEEALQHLAESATTLSRSS